MKTAILSFTVFALVAFSCARADEIAQEEVSDTQEEAIKKNPEEFRLDWEGKGAGGGGITTGGGYNRESSDYLFGYESVHAAMFIKREKGKHSWTPTVFLERSLTRKPKNGENYTEDKVVFSLESCFLSQSKDSEYQKIAKTPILEIPWTKAGVNSKILDDGNNTVKVQLTIDCKKTDSMEIILNLRKQDESGKNWVLKWVPDPDDKEEASVPET